MNDDVISKVTKKMPPPNRMADEGEDEAVNVAKEIWNAGKSGDFTAFAELLRDFVTNQC